MKSSSSFTLVELLIVIGILAILTAAVVIILNPAELLKQGRDAQRIQDLSSLNSALSLLTTQTPDISLGTASTVYISIPDTSATCANLGLPSLPSGYAYNCVTAANLRNTTGTGWIPVNFQGSGVSSLPTLPIDPTNTTSTGFYYTYIPGGSFELTAVLEAQKMKKSMDEDGGTQGGVYQAGTHKDLTPRFRDNTLLNYWTFDEGTGSTNQDFGIRKNNLTWVGTPAYTLRKTGDYAVNFSGSTVYAKTIAKAVEEFDDEVTIAAWVNLGAAVSGTNARLITTADAATLGPFWITQRYGGSQMDWYGKNAAGTGVSAITSSAQTSVWIHMVGTYKDDVLRFYFDGVQRATNSLPSPLKPVNNYIWIGSSNGYVGMIDDVRIYNRALSQSEIMALYNETRE